MLLLTFLLMCGAAGLVACAAGMVVYDIYLAYELDRLLRGNGMPAGTPVGAGQVPLLAPVHPRVRRQIRIKPAAKLVAIAAACSLAGQSIVVIPDGQGGVKISQIYGVLPGTLYAGTHVVLPFFDHVQTYDIRDQVFATAATEGPKEKNEILEVDAKEGLPIGLAVTVRYRIDPRRLDYVQSNLAQPIDSQIVEPVVTAAFRELGPNYVVRDVFSTKRDEFSQRAAQMITTRLAQDAIVVKEVLVRKIELPPQYARGLQDLLLKEQQDDQADVDAEIEAKRVKIAGSQAESAKVRSVKHAEADAEQQVIMAKAESDAMQYTLPLKQKQIEQSRLEAEARKEATIQNADAAAQAKVIDSKAEQQRQELLAEAQAANTVTNAKAEQQRDELLAESRAQNKITDSKAEQASEMLLADAEANRIRVTAKAEGEQLQIEGAALHESPLLIQKIIAEKLSDKIQIMMVPNDGKFFFANDALKGLTLDDPTLAGRPTAKR
jgi:regulator of protease activity HflC (stomatin/prohibitin superfamily)